METLIHKDRYVSIYMLCLVYARSNVAGARVRVPKMTFVLSVKAPRGASHCASHFNMDSFQAKLAKQVRQYKHLYDPSSRDYRDIDMAMYAWNEIATTLGKDEAFCRKVWKNMRDRFVRAKKKIYVKTSHRRRIRLIPTILIELDWLSQFTKHRETDNNLEVITAAIICII